MGEETKLGMLCQEGTIWRTIIKKKPVPLGTGALHHLRETLHAQVDLADMPHNALAVHGLRPPAANPPALRKLITRHAFDSVHGEVSRESRAAEFVSTYCSVVIYPSTAIGSFFGHDKMLFEGEVGAEGHILYNL